MMGYGGFGYGMMGLGMLIPLVLIVLIVYAVVRLTSGDNRHRGNQNYERNEALNILNQRYAKGEISDEEYARKKSLLKD